jgi:UDP-N-acetylglucosamine--N-acetylmuramyl-(pentapeptide) pyrophosphoryl-undecaprenol N-acetylglucosamine transferase
MRVMIAGGGTGGHVYPGIALAREFQRQTAGTEILFVGTDRGLEARVIPREGFQLSTIRVRGLIGKGWLRGLSTLLRIPVSCWDAARIISRFKPDLIIGSGGYASGPVILMAWLMRKKRVILEINLVPGFTNRFLAPLADLVVVAWEGSKAYLSGKRIRLLGSPVRRELIAAGSASPSNTNTKKTIVLLGGSQGAHALNIAMLEAVDHFGFFTDEIEIIHQTGREDFDFVREAYAKKGIRARVEPFIEDMGAVYRQATVLISRAGATTVAEITACGKPSILVPFPHAAGGHQELNARALGAEGAALVVLQENLSGPILARMIIELLRDTERFDRMSGASRRLGRPDAAEKIVEACLELERKN